MAIGLRRDEQSAPVDTTGLGGAEYIERRLGLPPAEQVYRALMSYRWAIIAIVGGCLVVGVIATLLMTPQYSAASRIEISRQQANVTNVESVEEADRSRDLEFYETQYSLLEARSLAERVVRDQGLANNDDFFLLFEVDPDQSTLLENNTSDMITAQDRAARMSLATDVLLENVSITPIRGSSLVDVGFTSPDRRLSAEIANSWVEQFVASNLARRFSSTKDARDFLEEQLEVLRERLEESERQLVNYAANNEIVTLGGLETPGGNAGRQETLVSADLQAMNSALAAATADRIAAESVLRQGSGARESLSNIAINGLRQQRALIAAEREKLLTTFRPEYPTVAALTSELAALDQSLEQEEARVRDFAREAYNEARQREADLEQQVEELKGQFAGQNQSSIQYNIYQREVGTNRELYDGLLQRYKEIGVAGVGMNNVAVVDRARIPDKPSSPELLLNLALSLLLGLGLAGAYVFLREQLDQSLRDPADVKRLLGIAALGTVPSIDEEDVVDSLEDSKSIASEAYFSIGTSLSFLTGHGTPSSILLTSTMPNEGKSTSAVAIARMLARTGKRTLLIDGDMRNPSVHKFFGAENEAGLSNFLTGENDPSQLVLETGVANLAVMPAGPIPPNPAELLSGPRLEELIGSKILPFDHIVVDGPPVLGIADAPLLATAVEGVIFTIEANGTRMRMCEAAVDRLRAASATVFGAIVTKLDSRNVSYSYSQSYGYGYSYGSD